MMKSVGKGTRLILLTMGLMAHPLAWGQVTVSDDFSDGDFTANPPWSGRVAHHEVAAGELHLIAPAAAGQSHLYTASAIAQNASWEANFRMGFNPSTSNYAEFFFLLTDTLNLTGYGVRMGGSTPDRISLLRYNQGAATVLAESSDGWVNTSSVDLKVRVERQGNLFSVLADTAGGPPQVVCSATDASFPSSAWLGWRCTYTATRSTLFWMDNLLAVGDPFADTAAPAVLSAQTSGKRTATLVWSEPVDTANWKNRIWLASAGAPQALSLSGMSMTLTWPLPLPTAQNHPLQLLGFADSTGNATDTTLILSWNYGTPGLVVISEIMADPSPAVGLPEVEYLEFYVDTAADDLLLTGWTLRINQSVYPLLGHVQGGMHALLTRDTLAYPNALHVPLPTSAFSNDGARVALADPFGNLISEVAYSTPWYTNPDKDEGGWSLEAFELQPFPIKTEWGASFSSTGGTPGAPNSKQIPTSPKTPSTYPLPLVWGDTALGVAFTRPVADSMLLDPQAWDIQPYYSATAVHRISPTVFRLTLFLPWTGENPLRVFPPAPYGPPVDVHAPQPPLEAGISLNEVLFEPRPGVPEFVELQAEQPFLVSEVVLGRFDASMNTVFSHERIASLPFVIPANQAWAFTTDTAALRRGYAQTGNLFPADALPSLPNDGSTLAVGTLGLEALEGMTYDPGMHFELIEDAAGYSLERLSTSLPSNQASSWHSGAQTVGGATPGASNSTRLAQSGSGTDVRVEPAVITPNGDGDADVATLSWSFTGNDLTLTVVIFDLHGRKVRTLANNVLAAPEGFVVWDGTDEAGARVNGGSYIVWMQATELSGTSKTYRKSLGVSH